MDWGKYSILGKLKPAQVSKTNAKKISVTTSHQSASAQPSSGKQGSIMFNDNLGGQMP